MVRGEFGRWCEDTRNVLTTVLQQVPVTGELTLGGVAIAWTIAIPAGVVAAWRRRTAVDYSASAAALTGLSIPNFWLGIMLIYLFAVHLRWLPASGFVPLSQDPALNLRTIVMPAFVLGVVLAAVVMRQLRSSMLEVLSADYVRTTTAKGIGGRVVPIRHVPCSALIHVVTVMGFP